MLLINFRKGNHIFSSFIHEKPELILPEYEFAYKPQIMLTSKKLCYYFFKATTYSSSKAIN